MASQAHNGAYVAHGLSESNQCVMEVTLSSALAAGQTLDITLPLGVDDDMLPCWFRAYSDATPNVDLNPAEANLVITNHNRSTGVTRLTGAAAGIADGAKILVGYCAASANS